MSEQEQPTKVIFRKWNNGDIIALFPEYAADNYGFMVESFEHIGQHGNAYYETVISITRPATPEEYADLKAELESYPYHYKLRVMQRSNATPEDRLRHTFQKEN